MNWPHFRQVLTSNFEFISTFISLASKQHYLTEPPPTHYLEDFLRQETSHSDCDEGFIYLGWKVAAAGTGLCQTKRKHTENGAEIQLQTANEFRSAYLTCQPVIVQCLRFLSCRSLPRHHHVYSIRDHVNPRQTLKFIVESKVYCNIFTRFKNSASPLF